MHGEKNTRIPPKNAPKIDTSSINESLQTYIFNLCDILVNSSIGVQMKQIGKIALLISAIPILSTKLIAAELLMVEQQGCYYCLEWKDQLGHIYSKTPEGKFAPLKPIDITDVDKISGLKRDVIFTPTFVLMENNKELGRLEGYSSEDFFWELLEAVSYTHLTLPTKRIV